MERKGMETALDTPPSEGQRNRYKKGTSSILKQKKKRAIND